MEHLPRIPTPIRASARRVRCPDCPRAFPANQHARYALHWRVTHGRGLGAATQPGVEQRG